MWCKCNANLINKTNKSVDALSSIKLIGNYPKKTVINHKIKNSNDAAKCM